ncbi:MAG TPA: phosphoglucosamine mutase [bacterium]|nr:phosphoglucosamine mutase [bacterium]
MFFRFSVSGARGIVGDGLDPKLALELSAAFSGILPTGPVILGRDSRTSGPALRRAVIAALTGCGRDVVDLGICPTPTVQLAVEWLRAAGGMIITASHNPAAWNGLKFVGARGTFIPPEELSRLKKIHSNGEYGWVSHDRIGSVSERKDLVARHVDEVVGLVDPRQIKNAGLNVVADCCRGAGGAVIPSLLEKLGVKFRCLGAETDGRFPRDPEPVPENLAELSQAVVESRADLGLAYDADVDRLALVGTDWKPIGEERTLQLACWALLDRGERGDLATNVSTSRGLDDVAARFGVKVHRTPVGEVNVVETIVEKNCLAGGEGNGGVIYPRLHLGRDALVATALIVEFLARSGKGILGLVEELPVYVMLKRKAPMPEERVLRRVYDRLRDVHPDAAFSELDGLRLDWGDRWLHLRPSGTEPIVRIFAEAPDEDTARGLVDGARAVLEAGDGG